MLIPSQYNGFDHKGRRVYNVDGGVGEAALVAEVVGAGEVGSAATAAGAAGAFDAAGMAGAGLEGMYGAGAGLGAGLGTGAFDMAGMAGAGLDSMYGAGAGLGAGLGTGAFDLAGSLDAGPLGLGAETAGTGTGAGATEAENFFGSSGIAKPENAPKNWYDMFFKQGGPNTNGILDFYKSMNMAGQLGAGALGSTLLGKLLGQNYRLPAAEKYSGPLSWFKYDPRQYKPDVVTPPANPYRAQYASGGITALATGGGLNAANGPVEQMSQNIVGAGGMYPQSQMERTNFATPTQMPTSAEVIGADYDAPTNPYTGAMMAAGGITSLGGIDDLIEEAETTAGGMANLRAKARSDDPNALAAIAKLEQKKMLEDMAKTHMASGGVSHLGSYSDGGRMLKGPGDGMSDSIPANIGGKQPARLAEGEFVVPADVVSHLGNGSTDAGAKRLYGMMDKVRKARTGTKKQGKQINPTKYLPE